MADAAHGGPRRPRRHWLGLAGRVVRLTALRPARSRAQTAALVRASYDRIAPGYDDAWTGHMRDLSIGLLDRLAAPAGAAALDLTCGSGLVAGELARRTGRLAVGVDASEGMIAVARERHGQACRFVRADAMDFLRACPPARFDVVTCAWGLGYCRPVAIVRQVARVLRPGGRFGVIDNTLFSLAGVLWASIRAFAESPAALAHVMNVRFLPHSAALAAVFRFSGLSVRARWDGSRTFRVADGPSAIERLTATGAAAGFEFAADAAERDRVFARFAEIVERDGGPAGASYTHRYLAVIGQKR